MLPEFELLRPKTLGEALDMLAEHAPDVMPIAGGTNVVVALRERDVRSSVLMDVSGLADLRGIRAENGHVVVGGGTTITELVESPLIAEKGMPLAAAAVQLGNPLIRNRATLAGNLVDASPAADTAPPLLVLDAEVELASKAGTRTVLLDDFLVGVNQTLCQPDELLVAVRWAAPDGAAAFHKIGLRKAGACSVATVAVRVACDAAGRCTKARIALGAVAPRPIRAHAAEAALVGTQLTDEDIAKAAKLAAGATSPIDDVRSTAAYRLHVSEVLVGRLLGEVRAAM
ncbi:MAG: xanthine dehydrogenase family protein subunit M [Anaerolineae bacterium]|nr:xanthine dehydrogenase family protein subunit M [Anaerolineae bacterium]